MGLARRPDFGEAQPQRRGLRLARNGDGGKRFGIAAPRSERRDRLGQLAPAFLALVAESPKPRGRTIAPRRLKTLFQRVDRRTPPGGLRRLGLGFGERDPGLVQRRARGVQFRLHARTLGDEVLERADRAYGKNEVLRLCFSGAAEPAEDLRNRVALSVAFAAANGDVLGGVVAAARFAPAVDAGCDAKGGRIVADASEFVFERPNRGLGAVLLRRKPDRLGLQLAKPLAPAIRRRRQVGQRRDARFGVAQGRQMRQTGQDPLDRLSPRPPLAQSLGRRLRVPPGPRRAGESIRHRSRPAYRPPRADA